MRASSAGETPDFQKFGIRRIKEECVAREEEHPEWNMKLNMRTLNVLMSGQPDAPHWWLPGEPDFNDEEDEEDGEGVEGGEEEEEQGALRICSPIGTSAADAPAPRSHGRISGALHECPAPTLGADVEGCSTRTCGHTVCELLRSCSTSSGGGLG